MSKAKTKKATGFVYALPNSVMVINGKEYRIGDSVDDWTPEQLEKHKHKVKPA